MEGDSTTVLDVDWFSTPNSASAKALCRCVGLGCARDVSIVGAMTEGSATGGSGRGSTFGEWMLSTIEFNNALALATLSLIAARDGAATAGCG